MSDHGPVTDPDSGPAGPQPFAHLSVPNAALYREVLLAFGRAKERFIVHLRPEGVAAELRRDGDEGGSPRRWTSWSSGATCGPMPTPAASPPSRTSTASGSCSSSPRRGRRPSRPSRCTRRRSGAGASCSRWRSPTSPTIWRPCRSWSPSTGAAPPSAVSMGEGARPRAITTMRRRKPVAHLRATYRAIKLIMLASGCATFVPAGGSAQPSSESSPRSVRSPTACCRSTRSPAGRGRNAGAACPRTPKPDSRSS